MNRTYYVIRKNYWQDSNWEIADCAESRKEAEAAKAELEATNTGNLRYDYHYEVLSKTDYIRRIGRDAYLYELQVYTYRGL